MTKQPAQIVAFPFAQRHWDDCDDPYEAIFQLKLAASQRLNAVAAGRDFLSEANLRGMHKINDLCREFGITPLDI
jgi:hypothetical protein